MKPLSILVLSTQRPGYGGAATSAYEMIRSLRGAGHACRGLFVDTPPEGTADGWQDPDGLGDVAGISREEAGDPDALRSAMGDGFDVVLAKNYGAAILAGDCGVPVVFWTSGLSHLARIDRPYLAGPSDAPPPADSLDARAIGATTATMCHSDIVLAYWRRHLPADLTGKLLPSAVPTPDLVQSPGDVKPYDARRYDVAFVASRWDRPVKHPELAAYLSLAIDQEDAPLRAIVGEGWPIRLAHEEHLGTLTHAETLDVIADSRIVVIPSLFDAAPNVYTEAVVRGCNVIVSRNVGNVGKPARGLLLPDSLDLAESADVLRGALRLDKQLRHRKIAPAGTVKRVVAALRMVLR